MGKVILAIGHIEKGVELVGKLLGVAVVVAQLFGTASEHFGQKQEA